MVKLWCPGGYRHWLPRHKNQNELGCDFHLSPFSKYDLQLRSLTLFSFPGSCSQWAHLSSTSWQSAQHVSQMVPISPVMSYSLWVFSSNWLIEILRSPKLNPCPANGSQGRHLSWAGWLPLLVCSLPTVCPALLPPSHQHGITCSPVLMPPLTKPNCV